MIDVNIYKIFKSLKNVVVNFWGDYPGKFEKIANLHIYNLITMITWALPYKLM